MTSILLPQFKSAYRCCSQRRAPDRATKALASMTPAVRGQVSVDGGGTDHFLVVAGGAHRHAPAG